MLADCTPAASTGELEKQIVEAQSCWAKTDAKVEQESNRASVRIPGHSGKH